MISSTCTTNIHLIEILSGSRVFLLLVGFMYGTNVLDKDGVSAAVVMAEMAAYLQRQGLTLTDKLNKLYER